MHMIKVHSNNSAAVDDCYSVSGKHSLRFVMSTTNLEMLSGNYVQ